MNLLAVTVDHVVDGNFHVAGATLHDVSAPCTLKLHLGWILFSIAADVNLRNALALAASVGFHRLSGCTTLAGSLRTGWCIVTFAELGVLVIPSLALLCRRWLASGRLLAGVQGGRWKLKTRQGMRRSDRSRLLVGHRGSSQREAGDGVVIINQNGILRSSASATAGQVDGRHAGSQRSDEMPG